VYEKIFFSVKRNPVLGSSIGLPVLDELKQDKERDLVIFKQKLINDHIN